MTDSQMMYELPIVGGDQRGWATIQASVYYAAEAATVLHWNRLSDHVGRKHILLFGLLGTFSLSLWYVFGDEALKYSLVNGSQPHPSRFFSGTLNGNVGISKSVLAELADESNVAQAFSFLPLVFVVGQVIRSSIGGFLSRPQDRWPDYFPRPFWAEYPYFLPCLVIASFSLIQFTILAIFFEESQTSAISRPQESTSLQQDEEPVEQPLPLHSLLTRPVVISITNYGTLALLEIASSALIPLVWSTAIELGGLGLTPADIGLWMSAYGSPAITAVAFGLLYALFPFENMLARGTGTASVVWPLIVLQLVAISVSDMGLGVHVHFFCRANKRSLGALNSLAQTVISTQRAVGPAAAASLFAFSL
ncbi:major facilitator superfamily domain-containing protein [Lactarius deliciosus]|nr:major facilitator superfamily domain-containing protein [Lactarius deliciosus]